MLINKFQTIQYLRGNRVLKLRTRNGMGKTASQILDESHPSSVNYIEMKKLLTDPSQFCVVLSDAIPEMSNAIIVVLVLIATMAFQSAINPPGGVWAEDDDKSSRKAGQAVMASTHPHTYMTIMNANSAAFLCSLTAMFLFTIKIQHAVNPLVVIWMSIYTMGTALLAIMIAFLKSVYAITPHEVMQSKGNNATIAVLILVPAIFGLMPMCFVLVRDLYRSPRQVDLSAHAFPLRLRLLYWTSQQLDMHTIFRALR